MSSFDQMELPLAEGKKRLFRYRSESVADKGVIQQIFERQDYDLRRYKMTESCMQYLASAGGTRKHLIVDAGANIGASSLYFAHQYPLCKVVAIEPEKNNFQLLKLNSEGLDVQCIEGAVSCEPGTLFLSDPGIGDWGFRVEESGDYPVDVILIDKLLEEFPESEYLPFICKLDIEGSEARLFSKNYSWMDKFPLIIIELHDWMFPGRGISRNFLRALLDFNFDFVTRGENVFCFNNRLLRAVRQSG